MPKRGLSAGTAVASDGGCGELELGSGSAIAGDGNKIAGKREAGRRKYGICIPRRLVQPVILGLRASRYLPASERKIRENLLSLNPPLVKPQIKI